MPSPLRDPYAEVLSGPEVVVELKLVNEKLDKGFASVIDNLNGCFSGVYERLDKSAKKLDGIDQKLDSLAGEIHAGFTTMAGLLQEIRDRLPRVAE